MTVTPSSLKSKSVRKRSRNELEEEDQIIDDRLPVEDAITKRQNISKTTFQAIKPTLQMINPTKTDTQISKITPTRKATALVATVRSPTVRSGHAEIIHEKPNEMLKPPPVAAIQWDSSKATTYPVKGKEIRNATIGGGHELMELSEREVALDACSGNGGKWILLLVVLLAIVSGLWTFDRMSSEITIGSLRQDLQDCKALHSQSKMQDEYYVKEVETQVRVWRQEAKATRVELEAVKEACQKSQESKTSVV